MSRFWKRVPLAFAVALLACNAIIGNEDEISFPNSILPPPDASDPVPLGCNGERNCERVVFVTSAMIRGTGGAAAFEQACINAANGSELPRVAGHAFEPWISTVAVPAGVRIVHSTSRYLTPAGLLVATSYKDLTAGVLTSAILIDENGKPLANGEVVWTGTFTDGGIATNCEDWTVGKADFGLVGLVDGGWTRNEMTLGCGTEAHVYCFEK